MGNHRPETVLTRIAAMGTPEHSGSAIGVAVVRARRMCNRGPSAAQFRGGCGSPGYVVLERRTAIAGLHGSGVPLSSWFRLRPVRCCTIR